MIAPRHLALLAAALLGCAGAAAERQGPPVVETARPEPDSACRATVQAPLAANHLQQVVVKVAVDRGGRLQMVQFLSPSLSPSAAEELRQAFGQCLWKPARGTDGRPMAGSTTVVFRPAR